jgi:HAD superfamily hydrolase (TIGR01549 family)
VTAGAARAVRGVIFDLGGTLVYQHAEPEPDREHRQCSAIARMASDELGYRAPGMLAERLFALRNEHGNLTQRDLRERHARDTIAAAFREAQVAVNEEILDRAERLLFAPDRGRLLYPGAREVLEDLRGRGLRIGLISNWSSHWIVTEIVTGAGIREYFAPLVSSASFGWVKPHPSIFRHVLDVWNLDPGEAVMVGDTLETDIAGASGAGMRSILVELEQNQANRATNAGVSPTFRAKGLLEILRLLDG